MIFRYILGDLLPPIRVRIAGVFDIVNTMIPPFDLAFVASLHTQARLIAAARNPSRVDSAVVRDLSSTIAGQRRIEDIVGSESIIEPATGQLKLTIRLLRDARGPLADDLTAVGSEASQFAGLAAHRHRSTRFGE